MSTKRGLLLLAEECGEVVKEAVRFALRKTKKRVRLTDEAAQVVALIDVLIEDGAIDKERFNAVYRSEFNRYKEIING
jgi:NTP pyrophosphatase (non-canonical NTP hydrolase)